MKINRFWKKIQKTTHANGQDTSLVAWGGSRISIVEAAQQAKQRFSYIASQVSLGKTAWDYAYHDKEVREPIIKEQYANDDKSEWMITRNRYGALILNTQDVIFIDIDDDDYHSQPYSSKEALYEKIVENLASSDVDATIYETQGGFRLLVTNRLLAPEGQEVQDLLAYFESDKLYALLCKRHKCYRARLTPKPYQIGLASPDLTVLNHDSTQMRQWISNYKTESANYAVCKIRQPSQAAVTDPIIKQVQTIHDQYCVKKAHKLA